MKRATITFPDELEQRLDAYIAKQAAPPSLNVVVQTALEAFLDAQVWAAYSPQVAQQPFCISAADEASYISKDSNDVSSQADAYLAEAIYAQKIVSQQDQANSTKEKASS